jgi:hypothetical protein
MEKLNDGAVPVYEDEDLTAEGVTAHGRPDNAAQTVKAATHVCRKGTQIVMQRVIQAEHGQ